MIVHPKLGQPVLIWYNRRLAPSRPFHGMTGRVVVKAKGPGPRNHGIEIMGEDGRRTFCVVPCGNLNKVAQS